SDPRVVVRELRFQLAKGLFPSGELVPPQERSDSVEIVGIARHLGFNLNLCRIDYSRFGHLLRDALLQDLGQRRVAWIQSGVLTDAYHRRGPSLRGGLLVEQDLRSAKDHLARVQE